MKKIVVGALLLSISVFSTADAMGFLGKVAVGVARRAIESTDTAEGTNAVKQNETPEQKEWREAKEYFAKAKNAYAMRTQSPINDQNTHLLEALNNINIALTKCNNRSQFYFLASQVHRAMGHDAEARRYFITGLDIHKPYIDKYEEYNLNKRYAIACYSGDARYWDDYDIYKTEAFAKLESAIIAVECSIEKEKKKLVDKNSDRVDRAFSRIFIRKRELNLMFLNLCMAIMQDNHEEANKYYMLLKNDKNLKKEEELADFINKYSTLVVENSEGNNRKEAEMEFLASLSTELFWVIW